MSEFSCSYHLKSENVNDCISLIKRANVCGYVFPSRNGWVSFVIDEPDFTFSKKLINTNTGVLLNFINAEDHGWSFEIYSGSCKVCKFDCEFVLDDGFLNFSDEIVSEILSSGLMDDIKRYLPSRFSHNVYVENWDSFFDFSQLRILSKAFKMDKKTAKKEIITANDFASGIGLYFHEWISYEYIDQDFDALTACGEYDSLEIIQVKKD